MALFDELGKKITQTSQGAVQKTKNLADIAKINSMISEEEGKINTLLLQVGKVYYESHSKDPEEQQAANIQAISEAVVKIEQFKDKIKQIKGVSNCPNCGNEVANGSLFCNVCGTKMPVVKAPVSSLSCKECGSELAIGQKFCTNCGALVESTSSEANQVDEPASKTCQSCGKQFPVDAVFCTDCGSKL